jgi:hypothetical protein
MRLLAVLLASTTLCSAIRFAHIAPRAAVRSTPLIASATAEPPDDGETEEQRKQRLEALGRQAAEELQALDSASMDDGGLMAEFNARLDKEGGANLFKLKTGASAATESATDAAQAAKNKAADLADATRGLTRSLTEQQKNIGKIVLGLIAFNLLIQALASALSGGSGSSYSV